MVGNGKVTNIFTNIPMTKSEIFAKILSAVSSETEVSEDVILSNSKASEAVDARILLIKLLSEAGMYPCVIARLTGRTAAGIRYLLNSYECRKGIDKFLESNAQNIRKILKSNC